MAQRKEQKHKHYAFYIFFFFLSSGVSAIPQHTIIIIILYDEMKAHLV